MKSAGVKAILVVVALAGAAFALAGTASASHVVVNIATPHEATVGDAVAVQATLRSADEGLPIANTPVVFSTEGSFAGVSGQVELGRAVTDENGVATLNYVPRSAGDHEIRVQYETPGASEPEVATTSVSVSGSAQLHQSTAGVRVPGLNSWLIIALVTVVWSILFSVGLRGVAIARAGSDEPVPERVLAPSEAASQAASPARVSTTEA
jgi:hypothetical protein